MSEIKSTIMRFLPKSLKRKYLENSIQDVEDRIDLQRNQQFTMEEDLRN